jgi:hypothetical protein
MEAVKQSIKWVYLRKTFDLFIRKKTFELEVFHLFGIHSSYNLAVSLQNILSTFTTTMVKFSPADAALIYTKYNMSAVFSTKQ